jgi:hypothetical protein
VSSVRKLNAFLLVSYGESLTSIAWGVLKPGSNITNRFLHPIFCDWSLKFLVYLIVQDLFDFFFMAAFSRLEQKVW